MSIEIEFAGALRRASRAAFELIDVFSRQTNTNDEFMAYVGDRDGARAACLAAFRDTERLSPLLTIKGKWLDHTLTQLAWLSDARDVVQIPTDDNANAFHELQTKIYERWMSIAGDLNKIASRLEDRVARERNAADILSPGDLSVLYALKRHAPVPLVIERIEATMETMKQDTAVPIRLIDVLTTLSARTIQERLKTLALRGYVGRYNGTKGGWSITANGIAAIKRLG